jgi:glycosyltransferase involved in cell wall biosynthesis
VKILLVVHRFWPQLAGTELYTLNLARQLANQHEVLVYYRDHTSAAPGFQAADDRVAGIAVRRVSLNLTGLQRNRYRRFVSSYRNLEIEHDFDQTLARYQPEVVHFQHLMYLSVKLVELTCQRRIPTVITLHDFWFKCNNALLLRHTGELCHDNEEFRACVDCAAGRRRRPAVMRRLAAQVLKDRDWQLRQALRLAQVVISPSRFLKDEFVRDGYLPADAVQVVENGIDPTGILPHRVRADEDAVRFAYIGSIAPHKGVHVLVEAFNGIQGAAQLDIYGDLTVDPAHAGGLRQRIARPDIHLQGVVARAELWRVLSEVDVLVVPSLWYEANSPLVIREALAAGVPVVVSDLGAGPEKIRHGCNGWRFPAGDVVALRTTLQQVVDVPAQIVQMQREMPSVTSAEEHAQVIESIYATLLYR